MTPELIATLGGGIVGFVFKLIGNLVTYNANLAEMAIKQQIAADDSHDRASKRDGGKVVRWVIVGSILVAMIVIPAVAAYMGIGTTVEKPGLGGIFKLIGLSRDSWKTVQGFIILPEIRQGLLAILGFYFGASASKA